MIYIVIQNISDRLFLYFVSDTKWHDPSSYFSGPTSEPEIHFILPTGYYTLIVDCFYLNRCLSSFQFDMKWLLTITTNLFVQNVHNINISINWFNIIALTKLALPFDRTNLPQNIKLIFILTISDVLFPLWQ